MIIGADSTDKDGVNPFWTFSLALYDQPGVAAACIELQDQRGLDVNLLLFACYSSACGRRLGEDEVAALERAIEDIRETLVKPVRALRRHAASLDQQEVKRALQSAELAAEKAQQDAMWRVAAGFPVQTADAEDLLAENLRVVSGEALASFALLVEGLLPLAMPQH